MKSVKKTANLPKDRLVANCYSALLPSDTLWSDYVSEVNRLKLKGEITEHDYHVLIHSMAARDELMEQTYSSDENIFGSVNSILEKAKIKYTEELGAKLEEAESQVETNAKKIDRVVEKLSHFVNRTVLFSTIVLWSFFLGLGLIYTSPASISDLKKIDAMSFVFLALITLTILNLIFGFRLFDFCKVLADKCGKRTAEKVRYLIEKI